MHDDDVFNESLTATIDTIIAALSAPSDPKIRAKMRRLICAIGVAQIQTLVGHAAQHAPARRYQSFLALAANQAPGRRRNRRSLLSSDVGRSGDKEIERLMRRNKGII